MGSYGVYVWSTIGITVASLAIYLAYVYFKKGDQQ